MRELDSLTTTEQTAFDEGNVEVLVKSCPGRFEECEFDGIKLSPVTVRPSIFFECKFSNCNFAGVDLLGSSFRTVQFVDCNLMGINWTSLNRLENCKFQGCKLDFSCFQGLKLKRFTYASCSLKEVDFSEAQLSEADFSESTLRGAIFTKSDLSGANFRTAKEYFIDPMSTKIKGTKFCLPDALTLIAALGAEVEYS